MSFDEQLRRLEASHVQLMTDHEVFRREHDQFEKEQRQHWREMRRWQRSFAALRAQDRKAELERGKDLDQRISHFVSSLGDFMRRVPDK